MFTRATRVLSALLAGLFLVACADSPQETWKLSEGGLYSGSIGPVGTRVATGSVFHGGALWYMPSFERQFDWNLDTDRQLGSYSVFTSIDFSGDGSRVATVQARRLVVWSATEGEALAFYETPAPIRAVALNQNGRLVVLGLEDGTVAVFDVDTGETIQRMDGHQGAVHSVSLSADGSVALSGADDRRAILWRVEEGEVAQFRLHDNQVRTVALSQSGVYAFSAAHGGDGEIWNTNTGRVVRDVPAHGRAFSVARFTANDNRLLVGDRRHYVSVWRLEDMTRLSFWRLPEEGLFARTSHVILDVRAADSGVYALSSSGKLALLQ